MSLLCDGTARYQDLPMHLEQLCETVSFNQDQTKNQQRFTAIAICHPEKARIFGRACKWISDTEALFNEKKQKHVTDNI